MRLQLREAKGFPKAKEKPGQDPYDGKLLIGSIRSQSSCSHSALRLVYLAPVVNPLSPDSDQDQFSPNNIHMLPREIVMRVNKMIT